MGLMVMIGFNGNYNGVYWYEMDSIGGMLNHIGKMPKTHYKREFCNGFTGKSQWFIMYFNRNHWNFCDGFYCFFLAGSIAQEIMTSPIRKK